MTIRKFIKWCAVFLFAFSCQVALAEPVARVLANLPLTGALAPYGSAVREGVELAISDYNISDIKFEWEDNQSQPKTAVTILRKNLSKSPDIYISGVKPQLMAIEDDIGKAGIPNFVWVFDANIRNKYKNFYRVWVNFKAEPSVFINYANKRGAKKIAVVYVSLPHTDEEYNDFIIPGLKKVPGRDLMVDGYNFDKEDFSDLALKVRSFKPDLIIMSGFSNQLISMVKRFREQNLIKNGNTIATFDMVDAAKVMSPAELEGIRVVSPRFMVDANKSPQKEWTERFKAKFHKAPVYTNAYAYDMVSVILDAKKRISISQLHDKKVWIKRIEETDIPGVTGRLRFDDNGDIPPVLDVGYFKEGSLLLELD